MRRALNDYRRVDGELLYPGGHDNSGLKNLRAAEDDAQQGSARLLAAIDKAVFKFGWRHGINTDESRHLLLNTGVRLRQDA